MTLSIELSPEAEAKLEQMKADLHAAFEEVDPDEFAEKIAQAIQNDLVFCRNAQRIATEQLVRLFGTPPNLRNRLRR